MMSPEDYFKNSCTDGNRRGTDYKLKGNKMWFSLMLLIFIAIFICFKISSPIFNQNNPPPPMACDSYKVKSLECKTSWKPVPAYIRPTEQPNWGKKPNARK